jgi:hypothetical protein
MRRLGTLVAITALMAATTTLAFAQVQEFRIDFRHAASDSEARSWTPKSGSVISGDWRVVVDVTSSSPLKSFDLKIFPEASGITLGKSTLVSRSYSLGQNKTSDTIIFEWSTRSLTPFNGNYRLVSTATDWVDASRESKVGGISVNNAPIRPGDPAVTLQNGLPRVTWPPNEEPDLTAYTIYRSIGALEFREIALVSGSKNNWTDTEAPKGVTLKYAIVAWRNSVVDPGGISSVSSGESGSVFIPIPPGQNQQATELTPQQQTKLGPVKPKKLRAKPINRGFANLLPYSPDDLALPFGAPKTLGDEIEQQNYILNDASMADRIMSQNVANKPPFIAASLVMLVASIHMLRWARRLFSSP